MQLLCAGQEGVGGSKGSQVGQAPRHSCPTCPHHPHQHFEPQDPQEVHCWSLALLFQLTLLLPLRGPFSCPSQEVLWQLPAVSLLP